MAVISEIYMPVHLDCDVWEKPHKLYPYQMALRAAWEDETKRVRKKKNAALIYVSALPEEELAVGLKHPKRLSHPVDQEDIQRILRWQELLGSRMIVFPEVILTREEVLGKLQEHNLQVNPETVQVKAYGEFEDLCVNACKDEMVSALQMPSDNARIISRLSLSRGQSIRNRMRKLSVEE